MPNLTEDIRSDLTKIFSESDAVTEGREPFAIAKAIEKLRDMLEWSDRLGSDETHEIGQIIKLLVGK